MPPSPALRYSPGGEPKAESHKRGRSLEGSLLFREKEDDLALFNEMQTKERDNFLLQSSDDFEDVFSAKLRHFSDFKLGVSNPVRGESSELLNADGEKNDYDWLLTPPDTPLFPSLDDEPPPVAARRGRPRSQPISLSRSSTMEKSYRSSRGSASPNRLSPSPRSGNTALTRGRPSSASRSSPTPSLRSATPTPSVRSATPTPSLRSGTPTRRPSPPPRKASAAVPRSSTPTSRRVSLGSGCIATSPGVRGTSPVRTARGNSASPKIRAWQSNIPGFSLDAPPNLRTSLSDRPGSYVRGSSPASRNGSDVKFGRQSVSPTASRSVSSTYSHDRDRFSSQSKCSIASSGDDDADSIQSVSVSSTNCSVPVRVGSYPNNRASAFNKKSSKVLSPSSAPKRSFDTAIRQMDHRKSPPNMFRPLLSSVPSTTFYIGKGSSTHRSIISRNSSVTTSSNASSDQGTSVAPDTEGSDPHRDDATSESGKIPFSDAHEEIFAFDNIDGLNSNAQNGRHESMGKILGDELDEDPALESGARHPEKIDHNGTEMELDSSYDALSERVGLSEIGSNDNARICSKCASRYIVCEPVEEDNTLCPDCNRQYYLDAVSNMEKKGTVSASSLVLSMHIGETNKQFHESETIMDFPECSLVTDEIEPIVRAPKENDKQSQNCSGGTPLKSLVERGEQGQEIKEGDHKQDIIDQLTSGCSSPQEDHGDQQLQLSGYCLDSEVGSSGVAGIKVLLKRSSSSNGPVFQGRAFTAATIPHEDLSYARDSLRSSNSHDSASASSSVDYSSSRLTETRIQRQLSSRRSDVENYKYDMNTKLQSSGLSLSQSSSNSHPSLGLVVNSHEELEASIVRLKHDGEGAPLETTFEKLLPLDKKEVEFIGSSFTATAGHGEYARECNESSLNNCLNPEVLANTVRISSEENSAIPCANKEECLVYETEEDFSQNLRSGSDVEISSASLTMGQVQSANAVGGDVLPTSGNSSLPTILEIEVDNGAVSSNVEENEHGLPEKSVPVSAEKVVTCPGKERNTSDHADGILGESTVLVEGEGGTKARSLTLEEATDAILFCSSIVHDLAYQAATIAIEKENSVPIEESKSAVMVLGKSNTDRKEPHRRTAGRRPSKSLKPWQKQAEMNLISPPVKPENDENADELMIRNVGLPNNGVDSMKPPKLESKCNCSIM